VGTCLFNERAESLALGHGANPAFGIAELSAVVGHELGHFSQVPNATHPSSLRGARRNAGDEAISPPRQLQVPCKGASGRLRFTAWRELKVSSSATPYPEGGGRLPGGVDVIVLVDYDNIERLHRSNGPIPVVERILRALTTDLQNETDANFRLYGGWFDGPNFSRAAQAVSPALRSFPKPHKTAVGSVTVRAEMALGLASEPRKHLTHTFRNRGVPGTIFCPAAPFPNCAMPRQCLVAPMASFFQNSQCPEGLCKVSPSDLLSKPEQKLVDTMLTVDLLHFARRPRKETLVLVSHDDDLWPGIQASLAEGARVVHVHPKSGTATPQHYAAHASGSYKQTTL